MRPYAFSIVDLNNNLNPLMLDVDCPVQQLVPGLVEQVRAPHELNYVLVPDGWNQPLDGRFTLAQARIPVGAQLFLRPVRDSLLKKLLDELYDQARDEVKDRLMDAAKDRLKKIFNLDPAYPDPLHLKEQAWGAPQTQNPYQNQNSYQQQAGQTIRPPKTGGSKVGWIIAGIIGGGAVLVAGGLALAALVGGLVFINLDKTGRGGGGGEPRLGTGDVQVTLRWDAPADLDLHVIDPAGQEIWFITPTSSSGGTLDVDANGNCENLAASPVENVFWPTGGAPSGGYQVNVVYFMNCGTSGPVNYTVTVKNGQSVNTYTGTVNVEKDVNQVTGFSR